MATPRKRSSDHEKEHFPATQVYPKQRKRRCKNVSASSSRSLPVKLSRALGGDVGKHYAARRILLAFHDLGSENYAEVLTTYLAKYRDVARDEVVASPKDFRMQVKEHVENSHSETQIGA